jgi:pilus assembly protein CpaE
VSAPIRTLVAIDAGVDHDTVQASMPMNADIEIVGMIDGLDHSWATIQETATDLLVVACTGDSEKALFLIDGAVKQRPDRPVVVLYTGSPNGFVRRAFSAGADDILALPESPETVRFALEKAVVRKRGAAVGGAVATAPLICVLGPKGGTGKTLTTCNLGVGLASSGRRVAVVDLDLQFGDVGLSLGLAPERTIYDLAKSGGTLDSEKLDGYLARHRSGLRVLVAPARPDHASAITVQFLHEVYATLRSSHDFVVVDTPPGFTSEVIATIDSATHLCVVGMLDSLSLKNTKLGLETLELMGYESSHVTLVLNRADSRVGITNDDVYEIIGRRPDVLVPSDRDVSRAVNSGRPIILDKPRSDAARAFRHLTGLYVAAADSTDANATGPKRRRLLKRKG